MMFKLSHRDPYRNPYMVGHTTYNYFEKPKVISLSFMNVKSSRDTIIELISKRYPEFAEYRPHKVKLKNLEVLKQDYVYELDDKEDNILNNLEVFEIVNDLIMGDYSLIYDKALKKLNTLEKSNSINVKNDLLNW